MAESRSSAEKAAILLLAVGEDVSGAILSQLPPADARRILRAMQNLGRVPEADVEAVLLEFGSQLESLRKPGVVGDARAAQRLLDAAATGRLPRKEIARLFDLASPSLRELLRDADPAVIATLLREEHPQTIALTLAHMTPGACAMTLKILPSALHVEILKRIAGLEPVDPDTLIELGESLKTGIERMSRTAQTKVGGPKRVAEMLNKMEPELQARYLERLEERDPGLAEDVRALMFTFADIAKLDERGFQALIAVATETTLRLALRKADDDLKDAFFRNMSERRAERLRDDLEQSGKAPLKDVEAAQRELQELARGLVEDGKAQLKGAA